MDELNGLEMEASCQLLRHGYKEAALIMATKCSSFVFLRFPVTIQFYDELVDLMLHRQNRTLIVVVRSPALTDYKQLVMPTLSRILL